MGEIRRVEKEDAVKIAYYLMAVDGNIERCEKTFFKKVAEGFEVSDANAWNEAIDKTDDILDSTDDLDIIYKKVISEVDKLIKGPDEYVSRWSSVTANLLVWNLMTLAIKDMDFSANEIKMINHIAGKLDVDSTILVEMDNAIRALYAIQGEMKWLEDNSDDQYESDKLVKELKGRTKTIEDSIRIFIEKEM